MSAKGAAEKCGNVAYDVLTIFISIADVATDVWIAINFYNEDRMTFFWISVAILILAQCSYSISFALRYLISTFSLLFIVFIDHQIDMKRMKNGMYFKHAYAFVVCYHLGH